MSPRIIFAGNRPIAQKCLELLIEADLKPVALLLPEGPSADGGEGLKALLPDVPYLLGKSDDLVSQFQELEPDYLISIHYPHILSGEILSIPKQGALNLHPAYLPWNRGMNTPTWAIEEQTPFGVTLHWIDEGMDTGDIAMQERVEVYETDTANSLYHRAVEAEVELFKKALPAIQDGSLPRVPQEGEGSVHRLKDIPGIQKIDPSMNGEALMRRLRALTTNRPEEAAYIEVDGKRYAMRLDIEELPSS